MDFSPDPSSIGGTSGFRCLQELTEVRMPFVQNTFTSGVPGRDGASEKLQVQREALQISF